MDLWAFGTYDIRRPLVSCRIMVLILSVNAKILRRNESEVTKKTIRFSASIAMTSAAHPSKSCLFHVERR